MNRARDGRRLPVSLRKHLRREKARLRRELPPEEAARAIQRLSRALWREPDAPAGKVTG